MFTSNDRTHIKGLLKILNDGTFPLKAREVPAFTQIITWVQDLQIRMNEKPKAKEPKKTVQKKKA